MFIFVLPVSGGKFVSQLAILQHLCESNIRSDIILASSGGNVSAYITSASNWNTNSIERISRELKMEFFSTPWNDNPIISFIIGYFNKNAFNKGIGINNFLKYYFSQETIIKNEIWTGTYNKTKQKTRLFCNKKKEDSLIDPSFIDLNLTQNMEAIFCNGNMELISKVCVASASIPAIVPSEIIYDEEYIDGGISAASPLSFMQDSILNCTKERGKNMNLIYINSLDLSKSDYGECNNVIDKVKQATDDIIKSHIVNDRLVGHSLLRYFIKKKDKIRFTEFKCDYEFLNKYKKLIEEDRIKSSMLEIFPLELISISIVSFTENDLVSSIKKSYKICKCRLWYISEEEIKF